MTAEPTSAALRRVEQERDELSATVDRMAGDHIRLLNRNIAAEADLDAERDKRVEDIAAYERACGLAVVAEQERDALLSANGFLEGVAATALNERDELREARDAARESLRIATEQRDEANELTDKIAAELRLVTRERDSLARRCAVRFEETQALKAELEQSRGITVTPLAPPPPISVQKLWICTFCDAESEAPINDRHGALTPVTVTTTYRDL